MEEHRDNVHGTTIYSGLYRNEDCGGNAMIDSFTKEEVINLEDLPKKITIELAIKTNRDKRQLVAKIQNCLIVKKLRQSFSY